MTRKIVDILFNILSHIFYLILITFRFTKKQNLITSTNASKNKAIIEEQNSERLIIIDDDIGLNWEAVWKHGHYEFPYLKITDPDGGLELIYALRDPNVRVLGVTIMMGVANTEVCVQAAKNILKVLGIDDVPVLAGAKSPNDLGVETEAVRFIVETVMNNPGQVEIIATGPLTNIATAMMIEPRLPEYWHTLHFATGEFKGKLGEISDLYFPLLFGFRDLNVNCDIEATRYVLKYGGDFPIYPNEVMDDVLLNGADYKRIKSAGTRIGDFIAYELKIFNFLYSYFIPFSKGIVTHGVVPTGIVLDSDCECKIIESAVVLRDFGYQGYAFVLSDDPKLPKHKIYLKLSDKSRIKMHQTLIKRLM